VSVQCIEETKVDIEIIEQEELEEGHVLKVRAKLPAKERERLVGEAFEMFARQMQLDRDKNPDIKQALIDAAGEETVNRMISSYVITEVAPAIINMLMLKTMFNPEPMYDTTVLDEGDFEFEVGFILKPSYELTSYEPLNVQVPRFDVTSAMLSDRISELMDRYATYELASGDTVDIGDCAYAEIETTRDGEILKGLTGPNHLLHLQYGLMPDGFIDSIAGMKIGETKEFDFDAPRDDAETAEDTEVYHTKITVKDKRRRVVPALTDAFVKKNFSQQAKTANEFEQVITAEIQNELSKQSGPSRDMAVDDAWAKRLEGKIPDLYYEHSQSDLMGSLQYQLQRQQMTFEQYLAQQGMDENQFNMLLMMQAMGVLRQGFALDAIFRHLNEPILDEDLEYALSQLAPGHEEEARKEFDERNTWFVVHEVAERLKAHKWAMEHAVFED
jgi:trigger factor